MVKYILNGGTGELERIQMMPATLRESICGLIRGLNLDSAGHCWSHKILDVDSRV